jgi:hypothetical protein
VNSDNTNQLFLNGIEDAVNLCPPLNLIQPQNALIAIASKMKGQDWDFGLGHPPVARLLNA